MPILVLIRSNWKLIAIIAAILAVFYAGYHTRGAFDQIAADNALNAQIEANKQAQDELNARSTKVEAVLAAERIKSSDLQKRWSKLNGTKHTVCNLSPNVRQLLKDATTNQDTNAK